MVEVVRSVPLSPAAMEAEAQESQFGLGELEAIEECGQNRWALM